MDKLKLLLEINKVRITFAVTLTMLAGYALAKNAIDTGVILPMLGIFILACGAAALNHYQDKDRDALMERTRKRPIPSGKISGNTVLFISFVEIILGTYLIYLGSGFLAAQLGLLALIWYNAIFTRLNSKSAVAVIPGSIIGSIPPMVGWVAGGGSLTDPRLIILAFFFFVWQVPHFWLLMLNYGKEYENAGYPSITAKISKQQIKNATFIWTAATAIAALMLPVYGLVTTLFFKMIIIIAAVWLVAVFAPLLQKGKKEFNPFYYFMRINYFVLVMIISLSIDPLF